MNSIIMLIATALAFTGFIYFVRRFGTAWSMRSWCRTQGRVLIAEMRRGKKKAFEGCLLYDPVLLYSYAVGDRVFESSAFTHHAVQNVDRLTTDFITRCQKQTEVPVYYHPDDPAQAVVQPMPWQGYAVGATACAVLLALFVKSLITA